MTLSLIDKFIDFINFVDFSILTNNEPIFLLETVFNIMKAHCPLKY